MIHVGCRWRSISFPLKYLFWGPRKYSRTSLSRTPKKVSKNSSRWRCWRQISGVIFWSLKLLNTGNLSPSAFSGKSSQSDFAFVISWTRQWQFSSFSTSFQEVPWLHWLMLTSVSSERNKVRDSGGWFEVKGERNSYCSWSLYVFYEGKSNHARTNKSGDANNTLMLNSLIKIVISVRDHRVLCSSITRLWSCAGVNKSQMEQLKKNHSQRGTCWSGR